MIVTPLRFATLQSLTRHILERYPKRLSLATPLGLGKPVTLLNEVFKAIEADPSRTLEIYTALSLVPPRAKSDIERRFLNPFLERQFGSETPRLLYAEAMRRGRLPKNVKVHEFYFQAGQYLKNSESQTSYLSVNYTHAARAICDRGIDIVLQIVAQNPNNPAEFSLGCNPDVTLDIVDLQNKAGRPLPIFAVVHPDLPFTGGDAIVPENFFTGILNDPSACHELFALPRGSVDSVDHMIGLYASELIKDDGTLQIGIGSLSDALVHSSIMRQKENSTYRKYVHALYAKRPTPSRIERHHAPLVEGLYGTSEMIMDGFMHLRRAGILKRMIFDQDEKKLRYLHGAFFLGSKEFYSWLRSLRDQDFDGFSMTRVSKVNDLYDDHELALRRQRKNARFFNTCMKISLLGGAVSDTVETGEVVSGVGGQYNFVAMSHELSDSHSILMLRSTRLSGGKRKSNIVFSQPHETIPRHLRDIVITEYGIACLRGRTDNEVAQSLIEIADRQFQDELVSEAKAAGKLDPQYQIPEWARQNTPASIEYFMAGNRDTFPEYPFGSDFTATELNLVRALGELRSASTLGKLRTFAAGLGVDVKKWRPELERMGVEAPRTLKERLIRTLIAGAL